MPGEGAAPSRRAVLISGLSGVVAALAACSSGPAPSGSPAAPTSPSTSGATTIGDTPQLVTTTLGTQHVATGEQIATSDATRYRSAIGGTWRGGWRDTSGAHGTSDLTIALDVRRRAVRATIAAAGPILAGAEVAMAEYEIDLLGFARTAPSWSLQSPQLGTLAIQASGGTALSGRATKIPDHPEITSIEFEGTRTGHRVDGTYMITKADGSTVRGTMALIAGGSRGVPSDPNETSHDSPADIASGAYAQFLVTADALTKAMQRPVAAPTSNGGRLEAYAGIDASNAFALTADHDLRVAWTVYLGRSAEAISTFFGSALHGQPAVAGPWQHAYFLSEGASELYAYSGTRMLQVAVQQEVGAPVPSVQLVRDRTLAVAKVLFAEIDAH